MWQCSRSIILSAHARRHTVSRRNVGHVVGDERARARGPSLPVLLCPCPLDKASEAEVKRTDQAMVSRLYVHFFSRWFPNPQRPQLRCRKSEFTRPRTARAKQDLAYGAKSLGVD